MLDGLLIASDNTPIGFDPLTGELIVESYFLDDVKTYSILFATQTGLPGEDFVYFAKAVTVTIFGE